MNENVLEDIRQDIVQNFTPFFLADDSFLCGKATLNEASIYAELIKAYCAESGQGVNLKKSCLFFSNNIEPRTRSNNSNLLVIKNNLRPEKYLGWVFNFVAIGVQILQV